MNEGKRGRRRGGRRRRGGSARGSEGAPSAEPTADESQPPPPPRRRDTRARAPGASGPPPGPPGGQPSRGIRRSPTAAPERPQRSPRDQRPRDGRPREASRDRDRRPPPYEPPVPQDERSKELGARFKEAQVAVRDARKTLDKRKAEFGDEPQWLLDACNEAEARFAALATEWHEHLSGTGRKVVRS